MKNFVSFSDMETLLSGIGSKISSLESGLSSLEETVRNLGGFEAGDLAERVSALEERTVEYDDTELRQLISSEASTRAGADSALQSTVSTHTSQIAALQGKVSASLSGSTLYLNWYGGGTWRGHAVIPSFFIRASCNVWLKLIAAFSALRQSQSGIVTFFRTYFPISAMSAEI